MDWEWVELAESARARPSCPRAGDSDPATVAPGTTSPPVIDPKRPIPTSKRRDGAGGGFTSFTSEGARVGQGAGATGGNFTDVAMLGLNSASQVERTTATASARSAQEPVRSKVRSARRRPSGPSSSTCTVPSALDRYARCWPEPGFPVAKPEKSWAKRSPTSAGVGQALSPARGKSGRASQRATRAAITPSHASLETNALESD